MDYSKALNLAHYLCLADLSQVDLEKLKACQSQLDLGKPKAREMEQSSES